MNKIMAQTIIISLLPHTINPEVIRALDRLSMEEILEYTKEALLGLQHEDSAVDFAVKLLMLASAITYKELKNEDKPEANPKFKRTDGSEETMEEMLKRLSSEN